MADIKGEVIQVIGPVVDVSFEKSGTDLPSIHDALNIKRSDGGNLIIECQQHIGEHTIRAIAMDSTDGLQRGMEVISTGAAIKMPIGEHVRGRLLNVVGESIDGIDAVDNKDGYEIGPNRCYAIVQHSSNFIFYTAAAQRALKVEVLMKTKASSHSWAKASNIPYQTPCPPNRI